MEDYVCSTRTQKKAEADYAALVADAEKADRLYNDIPQTKGGTIISTDLARHLDVQYARDSAKGRPCDLAPSWAYAWRYAQDRLEREISRRGKRRRLRLMSGGWGSGKTYALERLKEENTQADLVWDGTLGDFKWAKATMEKALARNWQILIFHVHRNVELALYGAIQRSKKEGRSVPLADLPGNHRNVQKVVKRLYRKFENHSSIHFHLVHNTGTQDVPGNSLLIDLEAIDSGGALHYSPKYESYHAQAAKEIHRFG